jgi:hypothetical protein
MTELSRRAPQKNSLPGQIFSRPGLVPCADAKPTQRERDLLTRK